MRLPTLLRRGWPAVIELSREVPGPPPVVWELITDWEHQGDWMLEASEFEVLGTRREGMGVRARAKIRIGGITTVDTIDVVGWEPDRRLAIRHHGWVNGTGELILTPLPDDRTHVFWKEELHPPWGVLGAAGIAAFKPLMRRTFARDLRVLEGLVRWRYRALRDSGRQPSGT